MRININWSRNEAIQKQTRVGRASNCIEMSALRSGLHAALQFRAVVKQNKKSRQEDARAQNTNNFNDNLNNKTIFSLNTTNRAGRFFLWIDFFFRQNDFLFLRDRTKMKNAVKNIWLLWHAVLAVLSFARPAEKFIKTWNPRSSSRQLFHLPRNRFCFLKNFTKKQKSFFTPFASLFFVRRTMFGFRSLPAILRPMVINAQKTFFDVFAWILRSPSSLPVLAVDIVFDIDFNRGTKNVSTVWG